MFLRNISGPSPVAIDFMTEVQGVDFSTCYVRAEEITAVQVKVNLISPEDLIKAKEASGGFRDLDDISKLHGK